VSGETDWRTKVVGGLKRLHAISVENPALPGTPDVNYIEGWIELKWSRSWPARADSRVPCEHFSPQQRIFLRQRCDRGGRAHLLWKIADTWLLFDGAVAAKVVGKAPRAELEAAACWSYCGPAGEKALLAYLTTP